jgi:hypothetical protein
MGAAILLKYFQRFVMRCLTTPSVVWMAAWTMNDEVEIIWKRLDRGLIECCAFIFLERYHSVLITFVSAITWILLTNIIICSNHQFSLTLIPNSTLQGTKDVQAIINLTRLRVKPLAKKPLALGYQPSLVIQTSPDRAGEGRGSGWCYNWERSVSLFGCMHMMGTLP